ASACLSSASSPCSSFFFVLLVPPRSFPSFPTRRSSDLDSSLLLFGYLALKLNPQSMHCQPLQNPYFLHVALPVKARAFTGSATRSEEHTSELQVTFRPRMPASASKKKKVQLQ